MDKLDVLYGKILMLIETEVGVQGTPFTAGKFEGVGWLDFHYVCSTYDGKYPRIALKKQANGVHVYIMSSEYGILAEYVDIFGKTAIGKGCVRVKLLTEEREAGLVELIRRVKRLHEEVE